MRQGKPTHRVLEEEIAEDTEMMKKVQDLSYAHKLYAALCNTVWQPDDVIDILQEKTWSASWRSAGGIVAELRNCDEDYLNWYCSGFEGYVHEDIRKDLKRIGWVCIEEDSPEEFGGPIAEDQWLSPKGIAGALSNMSETVLAKFGAELLKENKK